MKYFGTGARKLHVHPRRLGALALLSCLIGWLVGVGSGGHAMAQGAAEPLKTMSSALSMGIISYWDHASASWQQVPRGSIVVLNPTNGILSSEDKPVDTTPWAALAKRLRARGVSVLGYVPTGHFDHCQLAFRTSCQSEARIRRQVDAYRTSIPDISGFFFDETSRADGLTRSYEEEFEFLRSLAPGLTHVFNPGAPNHDAVRAARPHDHVVLYEGDAVRYVGSTHQDIVSVTHAARQKNVQVWHLVHSVVDSCSMRLRLQEMRALGVTHGFVTNIGGNWQAGDPTWNQPPKYWTEEIAAVAELTRMGSSIAAH